VSRFDDASTLNAVERELKQLGFREVTIDSAGFRSGSLNEALQVHSIQLPPRIGAST
jgi:PP-loop superfamily ATP-utilizing enzyme